VERDDDIAKLSRIQIGMDEECCERDFTLNSKMNWKPVKTD